jgi:cytochrome c556
LAGKFRDSCGLSVALPRELVTVWCLLCLWWSLVGLLPFLFRKETVPMVRKLIRASLFAALGSMAMILSFGAAASNAQDKKGDKKSDKIADIHDIMSKVHGKEGAFGKLKAAVKGMKWEDAATYTKEVSTLAADLPKNDPPRGDKKSWEKLATKYHDSVKAAAEGVEKKDAKAAGTALGAIGGMCKTCHDSHKSK